MTKKKGWAWIAIGGVAGATIACVGEMEGTVHFNPSIPDFGAPPPALAVAAWGEHPGRPVPRSYDADPSWNETPEQGKARLARAAALRTQAAAQEKNGAWLLAAQVYERTISLDPERAEWARDRAEVLRQQAKAASKPDLRSYFAARDLIVRKRGKQARSALAEISGSPESGFLRSHATYALASILYDEGQPREAAVLYERVAQDKNSPRREPALIMAARSLLMPPLPSANWNEPPYPYGEEIARAREHLNRLLADYPNSRFRWNARGWLGRCDYLQGRRPAALRAYLVQLDTARNVSNQLSALSSIRYTLESLTPGQAAAVNEMVRNEPALLQPYLAFRIHHTAAAPRDLKGLASLARETLARRPGTKISSGLRARLAEILYLTGDPKGALESADASLAAGRSDLAAYVRGASLARLGRREEARDTFDSMVRAYPNSYLAKPARENLALQHERLGDFGRALDVYRALDYLYDVAYLVDIRMSPAEIARYIEDRVNDPKRDLWRYSLGVRYLRLGNLDEAERILAAIPEASRRKLAKPGSKDFAWYGAEGPTDKLYDPLTTTRDLKRLRARIVAAKSRTEKAEATYSLASYYYERRNLLLYNAPLWQGVREGAMATWNEKIATREDTRSLDRHAHEHETLARAREICLRLAAAYKETPAAAKALYRAATASRRLADFNSYWRSKDPKGSLYNQAADLLARVYTEYPKHPLAKNARKYERVFRQERGEAVRLAMFAMDE